MISNIVASRIHGPAEITARILLARLVARVYNVSSDMRWSVPCCKMYGSTITHFPKGCLPQHNLPGDNVLCAIHLQGSLLRDNFTRDNLLWHNPLTPVGQPLVELPPIVEIESTPFLDSGTRSLDQSDQRTSRPNVFLLFTVVWTFNWLVLVDQIIVSTVYLLAPRLTAVFNVLVGT